MNLDRIDAHRFQDYDTGRHLDARQPDRITLTTFRGAIAIPVEHDDRAVTAKLHEARWIAPEGHATSVDEDDRDYIAEMLRKITARGYGTYTVRYA